MDKVLHKVLHKVSYKVSHKVSRKVLPARCYTSVAGIIEQSGMKIGIIGGTGLDDPEIMSDIREYR